VSKYHHGYRDPTYYINRLDSVSWKICSFQYFTLQQQISMVKIFPPPASVSCIEE
jgi:hypothetical protein